MTAGNGAILAIFKATITPVVELAAYRWYADGTETGATALAAQDTDVLADFESGDFVGALRVRVQETAGGTTASTDTWQLEYDKNAGGYGSVAAPLVLADSYAEPTSPAR
jgi:hypothetical protein